MQEAQQPGLCVALAQQLARGPFSSAIFAFSCSPDIATGLKRLALFKPLVGPIRLELVDKPDRLTVHINSADISAPIPVSMQVFEIVYLLELLRCHSGEPIRPMAATFEGAPDPFPGFEPCLGVSAAISRGASLVLSAKDAKRNLISENAEIWEDFKPLLRRRMAERNA